MANIIAKKTKQRAFATTFASEYMAALSSLSCEVEKKEASGDEEEKTRVNLRVIGYVLTVAIKEMRKYDHKDPISSLIEQKTLDYERSKKVTHKRENETALLPVPTGIR